jgi:hypothetical protein
MSIFAQSSKLVRGNNPPLATPIKQSLARGMASSDPSARLLAMNWVTKNSILFAMTKQSFNTIKIKYIYEITLGLPD